MVNVSRFATGPNRWIKMYMCNKYLLWAVFLVVLGWFVSLVSTGDIQTAGILFLTGAVTVFFTKNMTVVFFAALIAAGIYKFGINEFIRREYYTNKSKKENFENGDGEDNEDDTEDTAAADDQEEETKKKKRSKRRKPATQNDEEE